MQTIYVKLETIERVNEFVSMISKLSCECDLIQGKYLVDAKSIMGIFSLDLTRVLQLNINSEDINLISFISNFSVEK